MPRESKTSKQQRARHIVSALKDRYPSPKAALNYVSPWELLVATILSAQCTDRKVNEVTQSLFQKYRSVEDFAAADLETLKQEIYSTGFYQRKAQSIIETAKAVTGNFGGQLPRTMDEMLLLPGVARKTANVVLGEAFGEATGVVVDTHVSRLALRMGLTPRQRTKTLNTDRIERDLMDLIPQEDWIFAGFALVLFGRDTCPARKPRCEECVVADHCPKIGVPS
ncbi:MAG: endonuclease III [Candidatus Latescibacteria bacterium]|jgi:endonuclease-3|nr:endonuclease III [Candidatus Latescibacterota bacterium]